MIEFVRSIAKDDTGATAIEYGLILALVFLAILGAAQAVGQNTISLWSGTSNTIVTASGTT